MGLTGDSGTPSVVPTSSLVVLVDEGGGGGGSGVLEVVDVSLGSATTSPVPDEGRTGFGLGASPVVVSGNCVGSFGVGGWKREEKNDDGSPSDCRNSMFDEDVLVDDSLDVVEVVISVDELVTIWRLMCRG